MEDWKEYRLDELYVFGNGLSKGSKYFGYGHPFVSFKTVFNNYFLPEELSDYVDSDEKEQAKCSVQKSDVLLTRTSETVNELGYSCVALRDYPKATFNGFCKRMRPITEGIIHDLYAGYYFRSSHFRNQVYSMSNMVTRASLSNEMLGRLTIKLPSYKTQAQIGELLFSIDRKIALNRQINDNLEQQAQALYKSWFVDFEPFKDGKFEESEIGLIPEGWCVGKAEDFYEINIGKTPPRKEHEWFTLDKSQNIWVSISDLGSDSRFIFDSSEYLTDKAIQKHNIVLVPENTVLLSFKLTIGRVGIAGTQLTTNEAIARFITNSVNREYTYFLLKNFNYSKLGSTSSIATAVNSKIIKAMMILMPNDECLLNFKKLVGPIIDGIKKNEEEILHLTELRDTLLPKLMSGELKINEIDC